MDVVGYKRVLLKLSGESLAGSQGHGVDFVAVKAIAAEIKKCQMLGVQLGIVVGGGNFWRGKGVWQMDKARADYMGMLATAMNALALYDFMIAAEIDVRLQMVVAMPAIAESYSRDRAVAHLERGRVVIFGGGTGGPYFSTDTAAVLKAIDIGADVVFKATHTTDGVYDKDPVVNSDAVQYEHLRFHEAIDKHLGFMDRAAVVLCEEHKMPVLVFGIKRPENLVLAVKGHKIGTLLDV
ncbi:MAG: UMP kinase [Oscillospiraceae bacterium]|jgi:uridylate kinase|nr:UMP kinase [Oscillospiraceae bacterium]